MQKKWAVGIDIGASKIEAALIESNGKITHLIREDTDVSGGAKAVALQVDQMVKALQRETPLKISGVGIGLPGQIDLDGKTLLFAHNLNWKNVNFIELLRLPYPIFLENDVRAATLGESSYGEGVGRKNFICLFLGTGIGGGIISNGNLIRGAFNCAGELGHMTVNFNGPLCTCGNRGCVEAYAGGWAIAKSAKQAIKESPAEGKKLLEMVEGKVEDINAQHVSIAAKAGDSLSLKIAQKAAEALSAGAISLMNAFNPECLILGGGLVKGFPQFKEIITTHVQNYAVLVGLPAMPILLSSCTANPALLGAATLVFKANKGLL